MMRCRGFTLIEPLMVIAIICAPIALLGDRDVLVPVDGRRGVMGAGQPCQR
jgi:prepilin-type N-terminal cleavage/methylation domain-containing protein